MSNRVPMNLKQVYAPTADKDEKAIEEYYSNLKIILQTTKKCEVTIIMTSGQLKHKSLTTCGRTMCGEYGVGKRNERADRLIEFCQNKDSIITTTIFMLSRRIL